MSRWTHEDVVASGVLGGALHAGARAVWPEPARDHFDDCAECRAILRADELARIAPVPATPRPRPALPALWKRLKARRAAPIEALAGALPAFVAARWRAEPNAMSLELRRTPKGVRAADSDAIHLLLFGVSRSEPPRLLDEARRDVPGVAVDAEWEPAGEARAVAIGARAPLDRVLWELWLADRFRGEWPDRLLAAEVADRLHLGDIDVREVREGMLRIVDELPPTTASVTVLLRRASAAGRDVGNEPAAKAYAEALELARREGDVTGEIKATLGLAQALDLLAFSLEAQALLTSLAAHHALDRRWGAQLCRQMAMRSLGVGDLDAAERWIEEGRPLEDTTAWLAMNEVELAWRRGDDAATLAAAERIAPISPDHAKIRDLFVDWALAGLARVAEVPDPLPHADDPHPHARLTRLSVAARVDAARGRPHDWPATADALARLMEQARGTVVSQTGWPLVMLVDEARSAGVPEAALLIRTRLLDPSDARNADVHALCALMGARNVVVAGPAADGRPRDVPAPLELGQLVGAARTEAQADQGDRALREIRRLLLPDGVPDGEIAIASDGSLADLPVAAMLATGWPADRDLPAIRVVTRPELRTRRDPAVTAIASLADAAGDLPEASAEVLPHEAAVHLRGRAATFEALGSLPAVGLIHLGLHGRRAHDVASVQFADRDVGPSDIAGLTFRGGPVVLLSGCATAHRTAGSGVERSLADAFLSAGASAVIATAWNFDDTEMSVVVRALLARWPFAAPAVAVSQVVGALRRQGTRRRTWAGLVVYQSWPSNQGGNDDRTDRPVARLLS